MGMGMDAPWKPLCVCVMSISECGEGRKGERAMEGRSGAELCYGERREWEEEDEDGGSWRSWPWRGENRRTGEVRVLGGCSLKIAGEPWKNGGMAMATAMGGGAREVDVDVWGGWGIVMVMVVVVE